MKSIIATCYNKVNARAYYTVHSLEKFEHYCPTIIIYKYPSVYLQFYRRQDRDMQSFV